MKTITLLPVKNEAWILPYTLENFSQFSDHIIIADQHSSDGSREIYKRFPKVSVIDNNSTGASNKIRWRLLREARKIPGNNLIICLDADELLSPKVVRTMKKLSNGKAISFQANWIQLIEDGTKYRIDGVWKDSVKEFAFIDDRLSVQYDEKELLIDHTARIPSIKTQFKVEYPILHLHYMAKARSEIKQVWYMCIELLNDVKPFRINHRYAAAKFKNIISAPIESKWVENITMPPLDVFADTYAKRRDEVSDMFVEKGILYFEPLDIWHIPELRDLFIKEVGREPKPSLAPRWLLRLNDIRNALKIKK
ncbi:glycosyltransferase family 2 protein [Candidatus Kaiserbacteria bacterium]|nr:MAG: glycosyltransferase family 2 protein [Candidatus Kaiserbacteria bacterium]